MVGEGANVGFVNLPYVFIIMATRNKTKEEIQSIINSIRANESIIDNHPEFAEDLMAENGRYAKRLEELRSIPIASARKVMDRKEIIADECSAQVSTTEKPCTHPEVFEGYCLVHLKQRSPERAMEYQRIRLNKEFGLTNQEIDKLQNMKGTLNNINRGLAEFIIGSRSKE